MDASVIVNTYERPRLLALVLEGLLHQTAGGFEIIVADDGSGEETRRVIDAFRARAPIPVLHARQKRDGARRAAVRNLGIRNASTGYCIFLDGDCIPPKDFVELHLKHRRPGCFLLGGYLRLTEEYSSGVTPAKIAAADYAGQMTPECIRMLRHHHRNAWLYNLLGVKDRPRMAGANFSAWKSDLAAVSGFNEDYTGWGREDSDLRTRLRRAGLKGRSIWPICIVYHLYHPIDTSKPNDLEINAELYARSSRVVRCSNGLVKESLRGQAQA